MRFPEIPGRPKRIVFERPDGMFQLMGTDAGLSSLPVTAESFTSLGDVIPFASLVKVTPRMALYRCPVVPKSYGSFHEAQR